MKQNKRNLGLLPFDKRKPETQETILFIFQNPDHNSHMAPTKFIKKKTKRICKKGKKTWKESKKLMRAELKIYKQ